MVNSIVGGTGGGYSRERDFAGVPRARPSIPSAELRARGFQKLIPAEKLARYRDNLHIFRELEILVVAETTSAILKTRYDLDHLRIVRTRYGAGV